jgi:hypothetical protein
MVVLLMWHDARGVNQTTLKILKSSLVLEIFVLPQKVLKLISYIFSKIMLFHMVPNLNVWICMYSSWCLFSSRSSCYLLQLVNIDHSDYIDSLVEHRQDHIGRWSLPWINFQCKCVNLRGCMNHGAHIRACVHPSFNIFIFVFQTIKFN